jgi:hypothetical protein
MGWKPIAKFTDIEAANRAGLPVIVQVFDDAGNETLVPMNVGKRYRIATEFINVLCTVVRIDHGARNPLTVTYITEWGDHLLGVFNPDKLLRVTPL